MDSGLAPEYRWPLWTRKNAAPPDPNHRNRQALPWVPEAISCIGHESHKHPNRKERSKVAAGSDAGRRESFHPQIAFVAYHAWNDLWRRRGRRHALYWRRRTAESNGVHRAIGRAESDHRSQGIGELAGPAKGSPDISGADSQRL